MKKFQLTVVYCYEEYGFDALPPTCDDHKGSWSIYSITSKRIKENSDQFEHFILWEWHAK